LSRIQRLSASHTAWLQSTTLVEILALWWMVSWTQQMLRSQRSMCLLKEPLQWPCLFPMTPDLKTLAVVMQEQAI
jgi:hypothetical protein